MCEETALHTIYGLFSVAGFLLWWPVAERIYLYVSGGRGEIKNVKGPHILWLGCLASFAFMVADWLDGMYLFYL